MAINLKDVEKRIIRAVESTFSVRNLTHLGSFFVNKIKSRTRAGFGVKDNLGDEQKLPKLKRRTVQIRRKLKSAGRLTGPGATPEKSAVNRSGKTLNKIKTTVRRKEIDIELDAEGARTANKLTDINSNYEFFNISKKELKQALAEVIEKDLIQSIKTHIR